MVTTFSTSGKHQRQLTLISPCRNKFDIEIFMQVLSFPDLCIRVFYAWILHNKLCVNPLISPVSVIRRGVGVERITCTASLSQGRRAQLLDVRGEGGDKKKKKNIKKTTTRSSQLRIQQGTACGCQWATCSDNEALFTQQVQAVQIWFRDAGVFYSWQPWSDLLL